MTREVDQSQLLGLTTLVNDDAVRELLDVVRLGEPFRYILMFDAREHAVAVLECARSWSTTHGALYYRAICLTRDGKWRLYMSNQKLKMYSLLTPATDIR